MRKLFVQFFLLLFVCFLVMAMLVGLVYKVTAERAGRQSMDDLMKSSLYLMRSELREIPLKDWNKTIGGNGGGDNGGNHADAIHGCCVLCIFICLYVLPILVKVSAVLSQ